MTGFEPRSLAIGSDHSFHCSRSSGETVGTIANSNNIQISNRVNCYFLGVNLPQQLVEKDCFDDNKNKIDFFITTSNASMPLNNSKSQKTTLELN